MNLARQIMTFFLATTIVFSGSSMAVHAHSEPPSPEALKIVFLKRLDSSLFELRAKEDQLVRLSEALQSKRRTKEGWNLGVDIGYFGLEIGVGTTVTGLLAKVLVRRAAISSRYTWFSSLIVGAGVIGIVSGISAFLGRKVFIHMTDRQMEQILEKLPSAQEEVDRLRAQVFALSTLDSIGGQYQNDVVKIPNIPQIPGYTYNMLRPGYNILIDLSPKLFNY
ncbi:MAG: hypothetical protein K2X47_09665 [Bdellovibrionales bacterium]|nr:hypothetical protein [Bdellovibrionales bacterium]